MVDRNRWFYDFELHGKMKFRKPAVNPWLAWWIINCRDFQNEDARKSCTQELLRRLRALSVTIHARGPFCSTFTVEFSIKKRESIYSYAFSI